MKKIALFASGVFFILQSCAKNRNLEDSDVLKDSSDDKIEIKGFLDESGVLNCYSHPQEILKLKVEFTIGKDEKLLKSEIFATSKENEGTIKDEAHGWFVRRLGILDVKMDLKGGNKSVTIFESFQEKSRESLVLQRINVSKNADVEEVITGLLTYKNGNSPIIINGKQESVNGVLVQCGNPLSSRN
ncbi:MAG: hypothetical protein WCI18_05550 [Pseudomonadota bacterium]